MYQRIAHLALVVKDYDEAIQFYTEKLGFTLLEDTQLSEVKRWVLVAPPGAKECSLLLAKAANEEQLASVGNQTGGRVFLFLFTDDFRRDYNKLLEKEVHFVRPPKEEEYGLLLFLKICMAICGTWFNPKNILKDICSPRLPKLHYVIAC